MPLVGLTDLLFYKGGIDSNDSIRESTVLYRSCDRDIYRASSVRDCESSSDFGMATPIIIGIGAVTAAIVGRSLIRRGLFAGRGAAEEWVKGGFKAKMDRKEAIAILGLRWVCVMFLEIFFFLTHTS